MVKDTIKGLSHKLFLLKETRKQVYYCCVTKQIFNTILRGWLSLTISVNKHGTRCSTGIIQFYLKNQNETLTYIGFNGQAQGAQCSTHRKKNGVRKTWSDNGSRQRRRTSRTHRNCFVDQAWRCVEKATN